LSVLDSHLTALLLNRYGDELTDYWTRLGDETNVADRENLAAARIRPLASANRPVFVEDMFAMMTAPGAKAGQGISLAWPGAALRLRGVSRQWKGHRPCAQAPRSRRA
jgi:hypothetical protein